ncbi:DNA polymerase III subunit gamma and tau [Streptomyces sp. gb14]|uniref:DNA polymerase III subunit gamma and tau n=1 Tax=Streptomyces sp. gb14 TaxID=1827753 RepID=UPI000BF1AF87|nr:DNA polymerase III subunit gamma and tau [Streptomyces sp. gb14]
MSSLALYRRYRPESFAEVIGQEHVTDPLQQALRNNRVNHAYLFSGPRGCGKTTSARILARCLNCEQGPTPTPCGECQSCQDLARNGPGSIDVIEIDAASHGGVDDARDLREKAFFGPASSRYKIYIIDEAHMVTPAGFNALLKVVEEPPEHLKFIFATTEPEKVIGTIRSRTHHYPFRLVPPGTLRSYLADVCGRENSPVEDGVLPLVVRAGAGSVRDSMSVMDQLLAGAGDDGVTYAMATSLLGYTDGSLLDSIVDAFAAGDGAAAFEVVDRVIEGGNDPRRFVADLLERLRDLVILAAVPDAGEKGLIDAPADVVERMQAQASVFGAAELSRAADLVNDGLTEMRGATSPRLQVELICARVLLPAAYDDERSLQARLDRLERGASAAAAAGAFAAPPVGAAPMGYVPGPDAHAAQAHAAPGPGGPDAARAAARGEAPPAAPAAYAPPPAPAAYAPPPAEPAPQAPPAPAPESGQRPGSWPAAAGAGSGAGEQARRPGGWPTASAPGSGPAPAATPPPAAAPVAPAAPAAPAAPEGGQNMAQGAAQVRNMWPDILEAVKNRRRFTWILLSQNAQVAGFDGTTLQLGFLNAGARDNFASSGSEEVLKQALAERFNAQWRIEAVIDPSGGGGTPPQAGGGGGRPAPQYQPAPVAPAAPVAYEPRPQHAPPQQSAPAPQGQPAPSAQQPPPAAPPQGRDAAPAPEASRSAYGAEPPRPVSPEDDVPEDDDPDLVDSALSGHDLIVRELGATVIDEFANEQ